MEFPKQSEIGRCGCCRSVPGVASEMERVMGIEPIGSYMQVNDLGESVMPSAIEVRDFAVRGAL